MCEECVWQFFEKSDVELISRLFSRLRVGSKHIICYHVVEKGRKMKCSYLADAMVACKGKDGSHVKIIVCDVHAGMRATNAQAPRASACHNC